MKISAWNTRGCGGIITRNNLKDIVKSERPDILFISETKNSAIYVGKLMKILGFTKWYTVDPPEITAGGLAIGWGDEVNLEVVHSSNFFINCLIQGNQGVGEVLLTCMYGSPYKQQNRAAVWDFVKEIATQAKLHWILLGDLNFVSSDEEKQGGNSFNSNKIEDITEAINFAGLQDLNYKKRLSLHTE